jgi:hypothetical protein
VERKESSIYFNSNPTTDQYTQKQTITTTDQFNSIRSSARSHSVDVPVQPLQSSQSSAPSASSALSHVHSTPIARSSAYYELKMGAFNKNYSALFSTYCSKYLKIQPEFQTQQKDGHNKQQQHKNKKNQQKSKFANSSSES